MVLPGCGLCLLSGFIMPKSKSTGRSGFRCVNGVTMCLWGGVRAYSTLGWFDDPVLSTMLVDSDTYLASVIFHELAHQVIYVPDDTRFQ